jgi:SAM-dependent methyltransferase
MFVYQSCEPQLCFFMGLRAEPTRVRRQSMSTTLRELTKRAVKGTLRVAGYDLIYAGQQDNYVKSFLDFEETMRAAAEAGMSIADFVDAEHNEPGATKAAIDKLVQIGVFSGTVERVCEIGPGSGRYLEKTIPACRPKYYEIYETALDWSRWLEHTYGVTAHPADGKSLGHTPDGSMDLVFAHKVFVYIPFLTTCSYLREMLRVSRVGGRLVFDIVTESCMDDQTVEKWFQSKLNYPCVMPKAYVCEFFEERGCALIGSFFVPMRPGRTECLVFRKEAPSGQAATLREL